MEKVDKKKRTEGLTVNSVLIKLEARRKIEDNLIYGMSLWPYRFVDKLDLRMCFFFCFFFYLNFIRKWYTDFGQTMK